MMAAHVLSSFRTLDAPGDLSVPGFVLQDAARFALRPALINATTGQQLTYSSLVDGVRRVASGLFRRFQRYQNTEQEAEQVLPPTGLQPRRPVVCVFSSARLQFPIIAHGVLQAGGTLCTVEGGLSTDDLVRRFEILLPDFVIADHDKVDDIKFAASKVGAIKEVIVMGKFLRGHVSVDELLRDDGRAALDDVTVNYKHDVSIVTFDLDPKGRLRGVMHTHHSFNSSVASLGCPSIAPISRYDVVCCCHPMTSMIGLVFYCGLLLREGATGVIFPNFTDKAMVEAIKKYKAEVIHITPAAAEYLAYDPKVPRSATSGLRRMYVSGAALREGVIGAVMARSSLTEVREGFGVAEAPAVLSVKKGDTLPGYAGQVCPNTQVQIRDILFGGVVEHETYGELCVRGPQIMKGYLYKGGARSDCIQDGWLHTGCIGQLELSLNFSLLGRMDDLIDYDSFHISPVELERVVRQHPDVDDVTVVAIDNHGAGHVPRGYVIKKPGADVIELDIIEYVAEEVENHKKLRGGVVFVDELPKSMNGEPERYKLQAEALREQLDIPLGEHAKWPPDGDYLDDMNVVTTASRRSYLLTNDATWGQGLHMDSFEFSKHGSSIFSHSSLKFDSDLDGFITTRDKSQTPKTNENTPIRNKDICLAPKTSQQKVNAISEEITPKRPAHLSYRPKSPDIDMKLLKSPVSIEEKVELPFDPPPPKPTVKVTKPRSPMSNTLRTDIKMLLDSHRNEVFSVVDTQKIQVGQSVSFVNISGIESVQSQGGLGLNGVSHNISDIPDLSVDVQPPISTSTPKNSPHHDRKNKEQVACSITFKEQKQSWKDKSAFHKNRTRQALYDSAIDSSDSSIYPNTTDTSIDNSPVKQVKFERIRPKRRNHSPPRKPSPQVTPTLTRKKETNLRDAMNMSAEAIREAMNLEDGRHGKSKRNSNNMGGNTWKSTGDLSVLAKKLESEEEESVTKTPLAAAAERQSRPESRSRALVDPRWQAAQNIRMRATQYSESVRRREIGLHSSSNRSLSSSRGLSSYGSSFNRGSGSNSSNGSGTILYTPRSRSKSSDRSSYLTGSRGYSSPFSLSNRLDLV